MLATFYLKSMIPLRTVAIFSNLGFARYGFLSGAIPIAVLHCLLLPLNLLRLRATQSPVIPSEPITSAGR